VTDNGSDNLGAFVVKFITSLFELCIPIQNGVDIESKVFIGLGRSKEWKVLMA
jgi:hypothetical protein